MVNLTINHSLHIPLPIFKAYVEGQELPLGVAQKSTIQQCALKIRHCTAPWENFVQEGLSFECDCHLNETCHLLFLFKMFPFNTNDTLEVQFTDGSVYLRKHVLFNTAIDIYADGKTKITWAELLPITQVFEAGASTVLY